MIVLKKTNPERETVSAVGGGETIKCTPNKNNNIICRLHSFTLKSPSV